jgi:hypothetical protein
MTASMEEMAASAQELADMGLSLRDMVSKFKVGDVQTADRRPQTTDQKSRADVTKFAKLKEHTVAVKKKFAEFKDKHPNA